MGVPLVLAGIQGAIGLGQTIAGLAKKKEEIPTYQIAPEVRDAHARSMANLSGVSAQAKEGMAQAAQNAQATTAMSSRFASSGANALDAARIAGSQYKDNIASIMNFENQNQMQLERSAQSTANMMANERTKQFQSKQELAAMKEQQRQSLIGAGFKTVTDAIGNYGNLEFAKALNKGPQAMFKPTPMFKTPEIPTNGLSIYNQPENSMMGYGLGSFINR